MGKATYHMAKETQICRNKNKATEAKTYEYTHAYQKHIHIHTLAAEAGTHWQHHELSVTKQGTRIIKTERNTKQT